MPRIAVLTDPLTAEEHNDLGVAYELMGEMELALKEYELAYKNDREWDQPLINHGNVHAGLENWDLAEDSYRKALERNPDNPEAMNNLAYVLMKQDKNDDALAWSAEAVKLHPDNPAFLNTHARACLRTGNHDRAKEIFTQALSHLPDEDPLREQVKQGLKEVETK